MTESDAIQLQNFDIEIKADGRWFHEGGEIKRLGLVKLFASVLSRDEAGRYWLTTPVEKGEITVADAPFVIQSLRVEGAGKSQVIYLCDNIDREHKLCAATPLEMQQGAKGEARPYIMLEKGLSALIKHAVFYEMAELAIAASQSENAAELLLWSDDIPFSLIPDMTIS